MNACLSKLEPLTLGHCCSALCDCDWRCGVTSFQDVSSMLLLTSHFTPPPLVFHFDLLSDFIPCCVFWALFQRFVLCPCKEMHRSVTVKASSYMNVHFYIRKWQRTKLPVIKAGVKTILHGKNKAEMGCLRQMKAVCLYFRLTTTIKTAFRAILPFLKLAISSFYVLVWLKCPYTRLKCIGLLNRWSDVSVF